jgi:LmbE family N-acetylglucosaminyl deacetylase
MATVVFFHAHPDDEAILTGGTMASLADAGHRVCLVVATRGELGEAKPDVLSEGEQLGMRRVMETFDSAAVLGVTRVEFLGYVDSGMAETDGNAHPYSFWQTSVESAAHRLAAILREEQADVLVVYDAHGGYGHPDHIQVHRVGHRAGELAGTPLVYEATMNRDEIVRAMTEHADELPEDQRKQLEAGVEPEFGSPEHVITHRVDVSAVLDRKRAAMRVHRSQIAEDDFFLQLDNAAFGAAFGTEWYILPGMVRDEASPFVSSLVEAGRSL